MCVNGTHFFLQIPKNLIMEKFTIFKGSNGQYYFNLKASNGKVILQSEGYTQKSSCNTAIAAVKSNCLIDSRYHRKISTNSQYYFVLVANNSQSIAVSEMYSSKQMLELGVLSVKTNAPSATIIDITVSVF